MDVAVKVACCSGDGAQAVAINKNNKTILNFISFLQNLCHCERSEAIAH
jgi:hypothetical protein